jgi:aminotransferase
MTDRRSRRTSDLTQSYIRRMTRECNAVDGINLGQGICDLPTPPEILEAAAEAIRSDSYSTYSRYDGIAELREAIANKQRAAGFGDVDPERNVVTTIGSTGAFNCVVQSLFNPGDEFILFEPYYGYHLNTLKVGGLSPKFVALEPPSWEVTREALDAALTNKTRGVMICTPANPSGKVWTRQELEVVASFCKDNDLIAVTDEIYEYIVYEGAEHISLATLPGMWERTVTMGGFSKTFSITGWRLGTVVAHEDFAGPIGLVNDLFYVCAPSPLQHGVAVGLARLPASYYTDMAADYQAKRDAFCAVLQEIGLAPMIPDGAYYVLADISSLECADDKAAAMKLLNTVGVASVPGSSFLDRRSRRARGVLRRDRRRLGHRRRHGERSLFRVSPVCGPDSGRAVCR